MSETYYLYCADAKTGALMYRVDSFNCERLAHKERARLAKRWGHDDPDRRYVVCFN